jgi:hypothetical protein
MTVTTLLALAIFGAACLVGFLGCLVAAVQTWLRR